MMKINTAENCWNSVSYNTIDESSVEITFIHVTHGLLH